MLVVAYVPLLAGTKIKDTIQANGKKFRGAVTVTWPTFTSPAGKLVLSGTQRVFSNNGQIQFELEPTPDCVVYTAQYIGDGPVFSEYWVVPTTGVTVPISTVRRATIPCSPAEPGSGSGSGSTGVLTAQYEVPSGLVNGTNHVFMLSLTPAAGGSVMLTCNGLMLKAGLDYNVSGQAITFVVGGAPETGDVLQAWVLTNASN